MRVHKPAQHILVVFEQADARDVAVFGEAGGEAGIDLQFDKPAQLGFAPKVVGRDAGVQHFKKEMFVF